MPDGFELDGFEEVTPDSYVLVDASTLKSVGKDYTYPMKVLNDYVPILTADWQRYAEEMTISELKDDGNFLVYFEQIVQKPKDNKAISTSRGSSGSGLVPNGKGRKPNLDASKQKPKRKKTWTVGALTSPV